MTLSLRMRKQSSRKPEARERTRPELSAKSNPEHLGISLTLITHRRQIMSYLSSTFKITLRHLALLCCVYVRQSKPDQVEKYAASTARQYALKQKMIELGWAEERVLVVDEDLGVSGTSSYRRDGFKEIERAVIAGTVGAIVYIDETR